MKGSNYTTYLQGLMLIILGTGLFTSGLLFIVGAPPLEAYYHLLKGSLGSWAKLGHLLRVWIPLTLSACGLLYAFRVGLWNIGVEGQIIMGAVFSTGILRSGITSDMPGILLPAAFLAGIAGGALWALLAGYLKTKGGVHEIFSGLGLNFVAQAMVLWLIFGPWKRPGIASMSGTEILPQHLWLTTFSALRLSPAGLSATFAAIVISAFLFRFTRIGLSLDAIGKNRNAARTLGLNPEYYFLLAMLFAGGFAGLAGTIQVTGVYHRLIPSISSNYGYLALLVVMLADYKLWPVPLIAFLFACLNVGSIQLPMALQVDSSLSGIIQGALVLTTLAVLGWRQKRNRLEELWN